MTYKLKITGSTKKPKIILWYTSPESPEIELEVKDTIQKVTALHKMKVHTCNLLGNDGTFLKNYNHLITKK